MSILKHVQTTKCPYCGCFVVIKESLDCISIKESKFLSHKNGKKSEHRVFLCGYEAHFSPDFSKDLEKGQCSFSEEYIKIRKKQIEDREKLQKFIKDNDIGPSAVRDCYFS